MRLPLGQDQVTGEFQVQEAQVDLSTIEKTLLITCKDEPRTGKELLDASGYTTRTGNFKRGLEKLLKNTYLEMTIPDKPTSSKQRYRLTDEGRKTISS